jgi:type I restriction enzyme S subunit
VSFKPYPRYKESGVEWLGRVPEHWEVRRLRQIGPLLKGSGGTKEDIVESGVPCVRYGDLYTTHSYFIRQARTFVTAERAADYFPILRGDVLFAASGEDLAEIGRSAVNLIEAEAVCGGDTVVLRPNSRTVPAFLGYACDCWVAKAQKAAMGRGTTVKHIYPDELKRLVIFVPSLDEQALIVSFLDHETAKIDALIAEQQRLIELLQEKRQAVISHAVTKGLNPDAPMKDSGIEWLGEVPEHWDVQRLGVVFREVSEQGQDDLPILSVSIHDGVSDKEMDEEELDRRVTRSDDRSKYKRVAPGDLVYNMMRAWQGAFGTVAVEGMVSPAYVVARPRASIATQYVEHLLRTPAAVEQMRRCSRGITDFRLRLYWDEFKNIRVLLPPISEMESICAAIGGIVEQAQALQAEAQQNITLLQERRSALISAAVTGQIDVRGFTADGSEAA